MESSFSELDKNDQQFVTARGRSPVQVQVATVHSHNGSKHPSGKTTAAGIICRTCYYVATKTVCRLVCEKTDDKSDSFATRGLKLGLLLLEIMKHKSAFNM